MCIEWIYASLHVWPYSPFVLYGRCAIYILWMVCSNGIRSEKLYAFHSICFICCIELNTYEALFAFAAVLTLPLYSRCAIVRRRSAVHVFDGCHCIATANANVLHTHTQTLSNVTAYLLAIRELWRLTILAHYSICFHLHECALLYSWLCAWAP